MEGICTAGSLSTLKVRDPIWRARGSTKSDSPHDPTTTMLPGYKTTKMWKNSKSVKTCSLIHSLNKFDERKDKKTGHRPRSLCGLTPGLSSDNAKKKYPVKQLAQFHQWGLQPTKQSTVYTTVSADCVKVNKSTTHKVTTVCQRTFWCLPPSSPCRGGDSYTRLLVNPRVKPFLWHLEHSWLIQTKLNTTPKSQRLTKQIELMANRGRFKSISWKWSLGVLFLYLVRDSKWLVALCDLSQLRAVS